MQLGVNIDHIATIRQARGTSYPCIIKATQLAELAGADSITLHLREDRRHMQDQDLFNLKPVIQTKMNLEMAATDEMLEIALQVMPEDICLVPERREERTTEGGLNLNSNFNHLKTFIAELAKNGVRVSLFISPDKDSIDQALELHAPVIELHTGHYADSISEEQAKELINIQNMASYAVKQGLVVNAGHGLNYDNVSAIAKIKEINELNIGHAIVAEALFLGWEQAIIRMKSLIRQSL
jgi:pyridoxine 5-phosphate synthase